MGVLSIVLAANDTNKKLSTWTQICSAYSWLNVGGKLLKVVALKRLFAEEKDINRKLQKLSGRWSRPARLLSKSQNFRCRPCCLQPLTPLPMARPSVMLLRTTRDLVAHGVWGG